jgi:hypothetical protein
MPEDGLLDCLSCVSGTQEDMELKRRSKKIDRWDRGRNLQRDCVAGWNSKSSNEQFY